MDTFEVSDEEERSKIRQELSTMSFEELQKLKEKIGTKILNNTLFGNKQQKSIERPTTFERENKNRPQELSSKVKRVKRKLVKEPAKKRTIRDPRFDDLSGTFDEKLFKNSYGFISEIKEKEMTVLKKCGQKSQDADKKKEIQKLVLQMENKKNMEEKKIKTEERLRIHKKQQIEQIKKGKKPYFLKKSVLKKESLIEKFETLVKSGKLENYMSKKRKKNAAKEKKKLPFKS